MNRAPLLARNLLLGLCVCLAAPAAHARTTVLMSEGDAPKKQRPTPTQVVSAQMGVIEDAALNAYVEGIGRKLLRALPRRTAKYQFKVVDQVEPNAFALPGGEIFISRGLLALVNDEDELACVIGHEISHVALRHAMAQQAVGRSSGGLISPWIRQGRMAAYSRDLERSADKGGQILCAAAGYDPRGLARFLDSMSRSEKLLIGHSRNASFFDTHPTSSRRSAVANVRASELRWKRDPAIGNPRESVLKAIDGLPVGQRPESGIFRGPIFLHPELGFKLRFPRNWRTANSNLMVGAQAPTGDAVVFLSADAKPGDPQEVAENWFDQSKGQFGGLKKSGPFTAGRTRAWQLELEGSGGRGPMFSQVTFIPHAGANWRLTGSAKGPEELRPTYATARSFRTLGPEDMKVIRKTQLRIVKAEAGENLKTLSQRTGNAWSVGNTAALNSMTATVQFKGGELVKISRESAYTPKKR